jgi:serine protease Do
MASPRIKRLQSPAAFVAYLGFCIVGATAVATGCSGDAEASETAEPADAAEPAPVQAASPPTDAAHPGDPRPSLAPMIARVSGAVVSIHAYGKPIGGGGLFGGTPRGQGNGSGFIYDAAGIVITNHHVVDGAERLEVKLADGRTFDAENLGSDPATDIAVIRLSEADNLPTVEIGSSSALQIGDWVVAIGSPMGLEHSASVGILSGRGRGDLGLYADSYLDFLQTDADIAPGSSGGPLFDLDGRVVGINTAVGAASGPGFAIPIDQAVAIIPKLRDEGEIVRGWLGASSAPREDGGKGAVIGTVYAGTPADDASLRSGDIVTEIDGNPVDSFETLRAYIAAQSPGHTVLMKVDRDGETLELTAVLDARPAGEDLESLRERRRPRRSAPRALPPPPPPKSEGGASGARLGVRARATADGLEVVDVEPGSLADGLDLQPGDVVVEVNGARVRDPADVAAALGGSTRRVEVELLRNGSRQRVTFERS